MSFIKFLPENKRNELRLKWEKQNVLEYFNALENFVNEFKKNKNTVYYNAKQELPGVEPQIEETSQNENPSCKYNELLIELLKFSKNIKTKNVLQVKELKRRFNEQFKEKVTRLNFNNDNIIKCSPHLEKLKLSALKILDTSQNELPTFSFTKALIPTAKKVVKKLKFNVKSLKKLIQYIDNPMFKY